jgi:transcriptional regulator with XRE-family HTH domain
MRIQKDPPGYPGDEAIHKAFVENLRLIRIAKGLSIEQADALVAEAIRKDSPSNTPRAIGIIREKRGMTRCALGRAAGLSVRLIVRIERGRANPTLAEVARLSLGLECDITELVQRVYATKRKLDIERFSHNEAAQTEHPADAPIPKERTKNP